MASSSKLNSKTILDLVEAHDVAKNKRYKKGKFLGKVRCFLMPWYTVTIIIFS